MRDQSQGSSFGPGVFSNYDVRLELHSYNDNNWGGKATVFDPKDLYVRILEDQYSAADGKLLDTATAMYKELRQLNAAGSLRIDPREASKAELYKWTGERYDFDLFHPTGYDGALSNGLKVHYTFDETTGPVVDVSGNGNNGTASSVSRYSSGYVRTRGGSVSAGVPSGMTMEEVTIAAYCPFWEDDGWVPSTWWSVVTADREFIIELTDWGTISAKEIDRSTNTAVGNQIVSNQWLAQRFPLHIAVTMSKASNEWKLYLNGIQIGSTQTWNKDAAITQIIFGGRAASGYNLDSYLDNVRIYNRALAPTEVRAIGDTTSRRIGRLKRIVDRNGYATTLNYKTFTTAEYAASLDRLWQIDTVTDPHGRTATFNYHTSQVGGRWVVSKIDLPPHGGSARDIDYAYEDGVHLTKVTHPDGTESTIAYGTDSPSNTSTVDYFEAAAEGVHRKKKVYLRNAADSSDEEAEGSAYNIYTASSMQARMITNGVDEVSYLNASNGTYIRIYEGSGQAKRLLDGTFAAFLKDGWTFGTASAGYNAFSGTEETNYQQSYFTSNAHYIKDIPYRKRDRQGRTKDYTYDADTFPTVVTYPDSTTEKYTYNSFKQVTRYEDRLGRVTKMTYDARGNMTQREVGIKVVSGTDTNQAEYASETWEYYAAAHANQYLLKAHVDFGGHRTEYVYNSNHFLTEIKEPNDNGTGLHTAQTFTYDSVGRLSTATDAASRTTTYEYDVRDRQVKTTYADSSYEQTTYGSGTNANLVTQTRDRNGNLTTFAYDGAGRLTTKVAAYGSAVAATTTYTYLPGTELVATETENGDKTTYTYDYRQRVKTVTVQPRTGTTLTTTSTYTNNELTQTADPYGRKTYPVYRSSDGKLTRIVQGLVPSDGVSTPSSTTRDSAANAKYRVIDLTLDAEGQVTQVTDPRGFNHTAAYDSRGRRVERIQAYGNAAAAKTQYVYDADGNVTDIRHPRHFDSGDAHAGDFVTHYTYTARDLLASQTAGYGRTEASTTSFTYNTDGTRATTVDPRSNTWTSLWSPCCAERSTGGIDPSGASTNIVTDYAGNVTHRQVLSGVTVVAETTTRFDARHRPTHRCVWLATPPTVDPQNPPIAGEGGVSAADGLTTRWTYDDDLDDAAGLDSTFAAHLGSLGLGTDSDGSAVLTTNPAGERTLSVYDALDRVVRTVVLDGSGNMVTKTEKTYDAVVTISGYGDVVESTYADGLGYTNKFRADAARRTIQTADALNKLRNYTFDAAGNQLSVRDPNSVGADYTYDALSRLLTATDTQSNVTSATYDKHGNALTAVDAKTQTTTTKYDALDRLIRTTDRLSGVTQQTYDAADNLLTVVDAESRTTSYEYDSRNNLIKETYPDHALPSVNDVVEYTFDPLGRLATRTDQASVVTTMAYDKASRLLTRTYPTSGDVDTFTYDAGSRILTAASGRYSNTVGFTYDSAGRKATDYLTIGGQTYTTTSGYDAANRLTTLTYPDGVAAARTYTNRDQLYEVKNNGVTLATFAYDDAGRRSSRTLGDTPNTVTSYTYRSDDLLTAITTSGLPSYTYTYDANRNRTGETITGATANYGYATGGGGYDALDRLLAWTRSDSGKAQSWTLSAVGDWADFTENSVTQTRTHSTVHATTAVGGNAQTHDAKGNLTARHDGRTFTWDDENLLKNTTLSGTTVSFAYDALGRRVAKTAGGATTVYVTAGARELAEYASGALANAPTRKYVYADYIDEPVALLAGGNTYFYHQNANFNVGCLTNAAGSAIEYYTYDAYGKPAIFDNSLSSLSASAYGNSFAYTGRRLDPETGLYYYRARYYDAQLGRFIGRDPLGYVDGLSLYQYANGTPQNQVDPLGYEAMWPSDRTKRQNALGKWVAPNVFISRTHRTTYPDDPKLPVDRKILSDKEQLESIKDIQAFERQQAWSDHVARAGGSVGGQSFGNAVRRDIGQLGDKVAEVGVEAASYASGPVGVAANGIKACKDPTSVAAWAGVGIGIGGIVSQLDDLTKLGPNARAMALAKKLSQAQLSALTAKNLQYGMHNAAAATALGIDLSAVKIVDGTANVSIGYANSLRQADVDTLRKFLQSKGATKAIIDSGTVINPDLERVLRYLDKTGKSYPGGGRVRMTNDDLNIFELEFDLQ